MTAFMKTWSKESAFFSTKWATHIDFTTPKGPKITPTEKKKQNNKQEREKCKKKELREEKNTDIPLKFYIVLL